MSTFIPNKNQNQNQNPISNTNINQIFDNKFAPRYDTMSLSTLNKNDTNFKDFKKLDTQRKWSMNLCNMDIPSKIKIIK